MPKLSFHFLPTTQGRIDKIERITGKIGLSFVFLAFLDKGRYLVFYQGHFVYCLLLERENGRLDQFAAMPPTHLRQAVRTPVNPKGGIRPVTLMPAYLKTFGNIRHPGKQRNTGAFARIIFRPPANASHLVRQPVTNKHTRQPISSAVSLSSFHPAAHSRIQTCRSSSSFEPAGFYRSCRARFRLYP